MDVTVRGPAGCVPTNHVERALQLIDGEIVRVVVARVPLFHNPVFDVTVCADTNFPLRSDIERVYVRGYDAEKCQQNKLLHYN